MRNIFLLTILVCILSCDSSKQTNSTSKQPDTAVLQIGKLINYDAKTVEGSSEFDKTDSLIYVLYHPNKFNALKITMRTAKEEGNGSRILMNNEFDMDPEAHYMYNSYYVADLISEIGRGNFELSFIVKDSIIARKKFTLK